MGAGGGCWNKILDVKPLSSTRWAIQIERRLLPSTDEEGGRGVKEKKKEDRNSRQIMYSECPSNHDGYIGSRGGWR